MTSLQAKRKDELLLIKNEKKISGVYKKKKEEIIELLDAVHITKTKDETDYLQNYDRCDIFTPDDISQLMASKLAELVASPRTLLEPSVGTGNLLKYIPLDLYQSIDVFDIKPEYMESIMLKRLYFYSVTFLCFMDKLAQFFKKYRNEVIVGVLVFLILIFRDIIKSFL